jgi:hypothetical protein
MTGATASTFTVQVAVFNPSTVVTVMSAVPAASGVTTPFSSTLTIFGLLDVHVTFWFVAFEGATVAFIFLWLHQSLNQGLFDSMLHPLLQQFHLHLQRQQLSCR